MVEKQAKPERVEIGFDGGQVVATRIDARQLANLRKALDKGDGWHDLQSEDGDLAIDLDEVVFLRAASSEHRIGFSSGT